MKHYRLLVPVILALLVSSCASQKRAWYLQDANPFTPEQIAGQRIFLVGKLSFKRIA